MKLKFCIMKNGYFRSTTKIQLPGMTKKKQLSLHHFVWLLKAGEEPSLTIDHADIDKSNNQFSNLRLATIKQQSQHRRKQKSNTSGYIGVSHQHYVDKRRNKKYENDYWLMSIKNPNGKNKVKHFPYTDKGLIAAAKYYDSKAREYFGDFCGQLNFPSPSDKR